MSHERFLIAEVSSGPLARLDASASAAVDFQSLLWHAGSSSPFAPWTLRVEEIDDQGKPQHAVPHQWDGVRLHWKMPGRTPAQARRRFRIAFNAQPGPKPSKNVFDGRVVLTDLGREILFSFNNTELCRYRFRNVFKPFFCPVNGPHGNVVRDIVFDKEGHHFHHGLWIGYGSIDQNSANLWCESDEILPRRGPTGRMVHESFEEFTFGWVFGFFRERLAYQKPDGHVFAREWRTVRVSRPNADSLVIDLDIRLQEPEDTGPRGTMFSCRVAPSMQIVDASEGWNPPRPMDRPGKIEKGQAWTDFSGPVGSGWNGIALFDHPSNHGFPQAPRGAEYGLMSLDRTYPPTDECRSATVTYRYRAYIHNHDAQQGGVPEAWEDYARPCLVHLHWHEK